VPGTPWQILLFFKATVEHNRFVFDDGYRLLPIQIVTNCYTAEKHFSAKVVNI